MNPCVAAKRIANSLSSQRLQTLRGITVLSDDGAAAVFGNDDYAHDAETREEVRLIFERAAQDHIEVLSFATDDAEHSAWAMVLRCTDVEWLRARLREASYQSHCENGFHAGDRLPHASASDEFIEADAGETTDTDACLVEGEDGCF